MSCVSGYRLHGRLVHLCLRGQEVRLLEESLIPHPWGVPFECPRLHLIEVIGLFGWGPGGVNPSLV